MSILDFLKGQKSPTAGQPGASATTTVASGGGQPLTMQGLLKQLAEQRPALEERFQSDAVLFASQQRTARKIKPEAEATVAYKYLTARCDDVQFGSKVLFFQLIDGKETEVEGSRVQQLEEEYARMGSHSLADEQVDAVRTGRKQAFALPAGGHHAAPTAGRQQAQPEGQGVDMTDEEVLNKTPAGQRVMQRRQALPQPAAAPATDAVN